ncbi:MAG: hypothetical protein LLG42_06535 [Chloroflexi bacterium]|nr:hypothetical protein [Chloroflexota bacterium]
MVGGHPEGRCAGQIGGVETQAMAVAPSTLGRMQLLHQSLPIPALMHGQEIGQAQA